MDPAKLFWKIEQFSMCIQKFWDGLIKFILKLHLKSQTFC